MKATMSYLYCYFSDSGFLWIYSYKCYRTKTQETQDYSSSLWSTLSSVIIKSIENSLFTNVLSYFLSPCLICTRWRHDTFYLDLYKFYRTCSDTKKGGCIIKQHPDLMYGSKRPCDVWVPGTIHEHWSLPSYFIFEHACVHFVLKNQTQLLRIQIGQDKISETNAHISHTKISQRIQASRLQNTQ
jgi:hypothetical protein